MNRYSVGLVGGITLLFMGAIVSLLYIDQVGLRSLGLVIILAGVYWVRYVKKNRSHLQN